MNKLKIIAAVMGILVIGEGAGIIYFSNKSQNLSKQLKVITPVYERLSQEEKKFSTQYDTLVKEHEAVRKENEAMKVDRQNLMSQIKELLIYRNRVKECEELMTKITEDINTLQKQKQELESTNLSIQQELAALQQSETKMAEERDRLREVVAKKEKSNKTKELSDKISALQREKNRVDNNLNQTKKENEQLKARVEKAETHIEQLSAQLADYKKNYDIASKDNKKFEQEIRNMPSKFTEVARQNKILVRQTAEMHYNLGVFYTKNKEYERATAEFEKVIEIDPNHSYAHFNLGYIYAEYLVNRKKAIEHFRHFLRLAKSDDADADWVKKYILTWETFEGKAIMK
ncbi:MAG: tetratricopeptide repeat protein [Candidatus Omnitrophota bacterium]